LIAGPAIDTIETNDDPMMPSHLKSQRKRRMSVIAETGVAIYPLACGSSFQI